MPPLSTASNSSTSASVVVSSSEMVTAPLSSSRRFMPASAAEATSFVASPTWRAAAWDPHLIRLLCARAAWLVVCYMQGDDVSAP